MKLDLNTLQSEKSKGYAAQNSGAQLIFG